ncbi:L-ascorbate metabolism protein UlaG, beta-lactamase superfamily [Chitinophaga sp. CF118]|uniref:MBL fold metallo-hydrolase n=1 Tax=Chitinophaga sp. CF118 TaxID=1884367 RepID=UPI0008ED8DC0|nr:MBL fold metallo-hydrolase [Chitinophaga sp. CF118]SFE46917.1 L-ascorbate metabolism protein UlaG, beta-lactamase superfamily [Chitinophaga sp. CF118]
MIKLQLLRNATQILHINNKKVLIDPLLAPKHTYDSIPQTGNNLRNPLVDLPIDIEEVISQTDAVLLTHIHQDHWDITAQELLPKDILLFCQPANVDTIRKQGFINVQEIDDEIIWNGAKISRTSGKHGTGEIGQRMGTVSGYVINDGKESLYIAGDTIWCPEVKAAIDKYNPGHIVVNGGAARFITGDSIVMDIKDIITVCDYTPSAKIYVVHLEAVNHSTESRQKIKEAIKRCIVPDDGEIFIY